MKKFTAAMLLGLAFVAGCSTTGHFITPANTQLVVMGRNLDVPADGVVTTKPFSWGGAGGIPYRLEQNGAVVQQGKLRAKFRLNGGAMLCVRRTWLPIAPGMVL